MPLAGSEKFEILKKKQQKKIVVIFTERGVPLTPLWSGYWPQKETGYSSVDQVGVGGGEEFFRASMYVWYLQYGALFAMAW